MSEYPYFEGFNFDDFLTDFDSALDDYARSLYPPRGDETHAHVKDLGSCDRQTWARRSLQVMEPIEADDAYNFYLGFKTEDFVADACSKLDVISGVRLTMWPGLGGIEGKIVDENYVPGDWEMLGHPDGVTKHVIIEVKSIRSFRLPSLYEVQHKKRHYLLQAAAYALALHKPYFVVVVYSRSGCEHVRFGFKTADFELEVMQRMLDVLANTPANRPRPPIDLPAWSLVDAGKSWLCDYCPYRGCEENPKYVYSAEVPDEQATSNAS